MDHDVTAFRAAAGRENGSRTGLQRRYSPAVRAQAVRCWRVRRRAGESLRDVAVALGVAPWSLHRWTRASPTRARFHRVQVVPAAVLSVDTLRQISLLLDRENQRLIAKNLRLTAELARLRGVNDPERRDALGGRIPRIAGHHRRPDAACDPHG